jgi:hypothetical protein
MHLLLAFRAFFAALLGKTLPKEILPIGLLPEPVSPPPVAPTPPQVEAPKVEAPKAPAGPSPEAVAVKTLAILQAEGRLLDFLSEEIDGYADADVGAAVREVHRGCKKALRDHFELAPVRTEEEESKVTVPAGFNPSELRLVGNVVGQPPFSGTLKHKGWRAQVVRLPQIAADDALVIAPAEIEV